MSGHLEALAAAAPVNADRATVDWAGYHAGLAAAGLRAEDALAASWAQLSQANIAALIDSARLVTIFPSGVFASVGKKRLVSQEIKYDTIDFIQCRSYGADEHTDSRGLGKYAIGFAGPGNVFLGRLQWSWRAQRFRDSRAAIMAVAEERDRILAVIQASTR